jgi:hypothetical protein
VLRPLRRVDLGLEVVRQDLDLTFNADLTSSERHPVDEFVDPSLRRHEVTWGEIDVPANLQEIAEETWVQLGVLSDNHGQDDEAHKRLDELSDVYAALFRDASAIANDDAVAAGKRSRRKAIRETRTKLQNQQQAKQAQHSPAPQLAPGVVSRLRRIAGRAKRAVTSHVPR